MDTGMVILVVYVAGALVSIVPATRVFLRSDDDLADPSTEDIAMAATIAVTCVAPLWPLALVVWWVVALVKSDKPSRKGGAS